MTMSEQFAPVADWTHRRSGRQQRANIRKRIDGFEAIGFRVSADRGIALARPERVMGTRGKDEPLRVLRDVAADSLCLQREIPRDIDKKGGLGSHALQGIGVDNRRSEGGGNGDRIRQSAMIAVIVVSCVCDDDVRFYVVHERLQRPVERRIRDQRTVGKVKEQQICPQKVSRCLSLSAPRARQLTPVAGSALCAIGGDGESQLGAGRLPRGEGSKHEDLDIIGMCTECQYSHSSSSLVLCV